jgi:hypothetical protein
VEVVAHRSFERSPFPFGGSVTNYGTVPVRVAFARRGTSRRDERAGATIGEFVENLYAPTWRTPIHEGEPYEVEPTHGEHSSYGRWFRLARDSGLPNEDGMDVGDAIDYAISVSWPDGGTSECRFAFEIVKGNASEDMHWYTPILAIVLLPFFLIARLFGGGLN